MSTLSVAINLPFKPETIDDTMDIYGDIESSALYKMLPENARE